MMTIFGICYRVSPEQRVMLHPITFDTREEAEDTLGRLNKKLKDLKAQVFECDEPNHDKDKLCNE